MTETYDYPNFIRAERLHDLIQSQQEDAGQVRDVIAKSRALQPLTTDECAVLLAAHSTDLQEEILDTARGLKQKV